MFLVQVVAHTTEASIGTLLGAEKASYRRGRLARDDTMLAHKILSTVSITLAVNNILITSN